MMKRFITILVILIFQFAGFANSVLAQDRLIWNGDTTHFSVLSKPIQLLYLRDDIDSLSSIIFGEKEPGINTSWGTDYIADWRIIKNEIFLTAIFRVNHDNSIIKSDLESVFGAEYENGSVKANWISEQLLISKGKLVHFLGRGNEFYETEQVLTIKNGELIEQREYDNTKSYNSIFAENRDSLQNFIYSNIDWEKVPDLKNKKIKVLITIVSGETPMPDSIYISRGSENEKLNQEALRVVKQLPEWNVYYRRGEFCRITWNVAIIFDEQKRMKYAC